MHALSVIGAVLKVGVGWEWLYKACLVQDVEADCAAIKADCKLFEDINKNLQLEVSRANTTFRRFSNYLIILYILVWY